MLARKTENIEALLPEEPARKSYFLEKGFSDLGATVRGSFELNGATAKKSIASIKTKGTGVVSKFFWGVLYICATIAMGVFGTLLTLVISFFHSLVVFAIMICVYIMFGATRAIDNAYVGLRRVSSICDKCKVRSVLPGYKCPSCGKIHYRLRPNVYGIFRHTCSCGQKLPATFFLATKDTASGGKITRKKLEAVCANPQCSSENRAEETRPVCIPVAGSSSVGKTAFLNAAAVELIESLLPASGCEVEYYAPEKEALFSNAKSDFHKGEVTKTIEPTSPGEPSAFSMSFFVKHRSLKPKRLIHLFDIAGETFIGNHEHERQLHYGYSDGVVLIIDPMAIPEIADRHEDKLNEVDAKNIGRDDLNQVVASLIAKMQNAGLLSSGQKVSIPLAVVINKVDEPGVADSFTQDARSEYEARHPDRKKEDLEDGLCRQFMVDHGMGNFVNTLAVSFKTTRYFACSAMGHSKGEGAYEPQGVIEPIAWIVSMSDRPLSKLLGVNAGKRS